MRQAGMLAGAILLGMTAGAALAQQRPSPGMDVDEARLPPDQRARKVTASELYLGVRAGVLMEQDVKGADGNHIGEIQDILVNPAGRVTAVTVVAGGFLGIGDTAFRVPWRDVDLTPGQPGVRIDFTEETAERFGLFDGPDTVATGPREFRLSELIGDFVRLRDGTGYGMVNDVVIGRDGRVDGVLVTRDRRWGGSTYAYPYYGYGYGFDPGRDYYVIPFADARAAAEAPRVQPNRFSNDSQ